MICDDFVGLQSHANALAAGPLGRCRPAGFVAGPTAKNYSSPRSAALTVAPAGTALNIAVSGVW